MGSVDSRAQRGVADPKTPRRRHGQLHTDVLTSVWVQAVRPGCRSRCSRVGSGAGLVVGGVLRPPGRKDLGKTDTAAARSACDIGTRAGPSTVTGAVHEPRPPRRPLTM